MRIDNSHFISIFKKSVEKTEPSECITRPLTEEERSKYANIKPYDRKSNYDFMGHVTAHRKRVVY